MRTVFKAPVCDIIVRWLEIINFCQSPHIMFGLYLESLQPRLHLSQLWTSFNSSRRSKYSFSRSNYVRRTNIVMLLSSIIKFVTWRIRIMFVVVILLVSGVVYPNVRLDSVGSPWFMQGEAPWSLLPEYKQWNNVRELPPKTHVTLREWNINTNVKGKSGSFWCNVAIRFLQPL